MYIKQGSDYIATVHIEIDGVKEVLTDFELSAWVEDESDCLLLTAEMQKTSTDAYIKFNTSTLPKDADLKIVFKYIDNTGYTELLEVERLVVI